MSTLLTLAKASLLACSLALFASACGAPDSEDAFPDSSAEAPRTAEEKLEFMKETGVVFPPRTEEKKAPAYTWYSATTKRTIVATDDNLCALGELRGSTTADGVWRGLYTDLAEGRWKMAGTSNLRVSVNCVDQSAFRLPAASFTSISSPASAGVDWFGITSRVLWQGDSFSFIGELRENMDGMGEAVETTQAATATAFNTLIVDTGRVWPMKASALSYFAGNPGANRTVRLYGYRDGAFRRGAITSSGTYTFTISNFSGYSAYWMPATNDAFCALTRIQGRLGGGDDRVRGYRREGTQWYSEVSSMHQVTASFRCMAYDQT